MRGKLGYLRLLGRDEKGARSVKGVVGLFVSPHLDDAALSCGGVMAAIDRQGGRAVQMSVFTADEPVAGSLSPLAKELHRKWGLSKVVADRRQEDLRAAAVLGSDLICLGFHEAIYRSDGEPIGEPTRRHRCLSYQDLFSPPTAGDLLLAEKICGELREYIRAQRPSFIFGPVGIGQHVDHVIVRMALQQAVAETGAGGLLLYEEMPYASESWNAPSLRALRKTALPMTWELTGEDWERKLTSIQAYRSQLPTLWRDRDWRSALEDHARAVANGKLGERTWVTGVGPSVSGTWDRTR